MSASDGDGKPFRARRAAQHPIERDDNDARRPQGEGAGEVDCVHPTQAVTTRECGSEPRHRPVDDERRYRRPLLVELTRGGVGGDPREAPRAACGGYGGGRLGERQPRCYERRVPTVPARAPSRPRRERASRTPMRRSRASGLLRPAVTEQCVGDRVSLDRQRRRQRSPRPRRCRCASITHEPVEELVTRRGAEPHTGQTALGDDHLVAAGGAVDPFGEVLTELANSDFHAHSMKCTPRLAQVSATAMAVAIRPSRTATASPRRARPTRRALRSSPARRGDTAAPARASPAGARRSLRP